MVLFVYFTLFKSIYLAHLFNYPCDRPLSLSVNFAVYIPSHIVLNALDSSKVAMRDCGKTYDRGNGGEGGR